MKFKPKKIITRLSKSWSGFQKQPLIWFSGAICGAAIAVTSISMADTPNNTATANNLPVQDVQRFTQAMTLVKKYYVNPVTDQQLFEGAIEGMLSNLDPHSSYLDEEDFRELKDVTSGEFSGLGIEITPDNGVLKVISPIDDSPAQKAGIKPGDLIVKIDGELVTDMTLSEAVNKMRGKTGTKVHLTIIRKGAKAPLELDVERNVVKVKSIKSKLLDDKYGYIRISTFQTDTGPEMLRALQQLQKQAGGKLPGLILDLRNDPGGLLDAAVMVCNNLLNTDKLRYDDLIVYTKSRLPSSQFKIRADGSDLLNGAPLIVLINEGSASASEIVAGALQDQKRAVIVGTKSFGKGSVQTVLPLDDKTGLKITTALYYTPAGRSIQAEGIEPDIVIPNLKIPVNKRTNPALLLLKEADLKGHLQNGNSQAANQNSNNPSANQNSNSQSANQNSSENNDLSDDSDDDNDDSNNTPDLELASKDYQLFEALNILKAMTVLKNTN